eukprot:gene7751-10529_t
MSESKSEIVVADPVLSSDNSNQATAEEVKKLGNDAFLAKNYTEAIKWYSTAIELDPEVAVYYSNRSACYASLKEWMKAYEDALICISKDSKFIKGYYRLSSSQIELGRYDEAETTLRAALTLEPSNEVLIKQYKTLQTKKAGSLKTIDSKVKVKKQLDESQMKELMELRDQTGAYSRDLSLVESKLSVAQKDSRINQVTTHHIQSLAESTPLYRSVGKAFVFTDKKSMEDRLDQEIQMLTKTQRDLTDRQEYLRRRILSNTENMKDLTGGM